MSVVVSQCLPWSKEELQLDNSQRWQRLAPLVRQSVKTSGTFLLDTTQVSKEQVQVVVLSDALHVAEVFLKLNGVAACVVDPVGKITSSEIAQLSKENDLNLQNGLLIIKLGDDRRLEALEEQDAASALESVFEVALEGEAERAHLIALLGDMAKTWRYVEI
jgi:hypothetical protein